MNTIYISLLIMSCIIEYVTNKRTLNLEPNKQQKWIIYRGVLKTNLCLQSQNKTLNG